VGIWSKISGLLGVVLLATLAALGFEKAKNANLQRKAEKASRETEERVTDAMVEGLENESEVSDEIPSNPDHDLFGDQ